MCARYSVLSGVTTASVAVKQMALNTIWEKSIKIDNNFSNSDRVAAKDSPHAGHGKYQNDIITEDSM
jgi:hypothetical protein